MKAEVAKLVKVGAKIGKGAQKAKNFASSMVKLLDLTKEDL